MRILFAITLGETGGAQEHVRQHLAGLTAMGHTVGIVVESPSPLARSAADVGAEVIPWPSIHRNPDPIADLRARRELSRAVREWKPTVLHLNSAKAGVLGRGLLKPPDGVTVYTCHHPAYGPGRKWTHRLVGRPIEQLTLPWVDGIITDGARDLPLLRKLAPRVPITVIRNGVSSGGAPRSPTVPGLNALWVARMKHPKDPILAVAVWERVVREIPEARLEMCGTGPLADALVKRIALSPARDNIAYLGYVEDLAGHQETSSLFLLATSVEGGITMATLEAMAEGLVPVVSDAGDAFLLSHADCGIVAAKGDARGMAAAIVALLQDRPRIAAMRDRAIRFAREDWTAANMVRATEEWYRTLLDRSGTRAR